MTNETTQVAIIMGSDSDLPIVEAAFSILDSFGIKFTKNVMSAHRTPHDVMELIKNSEQNGCKVFIAAAGMAAHLPGVIAAMTPIPVIGVPINAALDGLDSLLAIVQMPPGIPVATVAVNGSLNAGILAAQIIATGNSEIFDKTVGYKENLKEKIVKANNELSSKKFKYRVQ